MKKILLSVLLSIGSLNCFANWDSATNMQTITVSAAFTQVQNSLKAVDGTSGTPPVTILAGTVLEVEGATVDDFETAIQVVDPTADRTITLPNETGTVLTTGSSPFVGSFTRSLDAASGNVAYTGIGFTPRYITFIGGKDADATLGFLSWGFASSAANRVISLTPTTTTSINSSNSIVLMESSTLSQNAVVNSYDSDGFTLAWTRSGTTSAGTATIIYMAFK